jgi:DNA (cytosine-5)-methyltransferase 1
MAASRPVVIDVFSGAGGLAEGLLAAGLDIAVAIEKHPHPALTCAFNHPNTTVICDDIASLDMATLAKFVRKRTGDSEVDVVAGGPPCQGFSPAGLRNPDDPRNLLFKEFVRVVEHFEPRMFLFENVPGFVNLYKGKAIKAVIKRFRSLGYKMHGISEESPNVFDELSLIQAMDFGVPQRRKRFVLIGWRDGELAKEFEFPSPTHGSQARGKTPRIGTKQALSDLEFLTSGHESHIYIDRARSEYQKSRRENGEILFNHLATKHRPATVQMYRRLRQGATIRSIPQEHRSGKQTMARLTEAECSKAVLALPDDFVHYRRHRIPTVREMARLQSFDDDFVFFGKRTTSDLNRRVDVPQYTQVGNAVPPLMARALGTALLRALGHRCKDLRDLRTRKKRHRWILGSSGFSGYSLAPEAQGKIDLVDNNGNRLCLPTSTTELPVVDQGRVTKWAIFPGRIRTA